MATHHVSLRRACPAPSGRFLHRRASVTSKATRLRRSAPRPMYVDAFTRGNDLPRNAAKHHLVGEVRSVLPTILPLASGSGNPPGPDRSPKRYPTFIPRAKARHPQPVSSIETMRRGCQTQARYAPGVPVLVGDAAARRGMQAGEKSALTPLAGERQLWRGPIGCELISKRVARPREPADPSSSWRTLGISSGWRRSDGVLVSRLLEDHHDAVGDG